MSVFAYIFLGENYHDGDTYPFVRKVFLESEHARAYGIANGYDSWHAVEISGPLTSGHLVTIRGEGRESVSQVQSWNGKSLSEQFLDYFGAIKYFREIERISNNGNEENIPPNDPK